MADFTNTVDVVGDEALADSIIELWGRRVGVIP